MSKTNRSLCLTLGPLDRLRSVWLAQEVLEECVDEAVEDDDPLKLEDLDSELDFF